MLDILRTLMCISVMSGIEYISASTVPEHERVQTHTPPPPPKQNATAIFIQQQNFGHIRLRLLTGSLHNLESIISPNIKLFHFFLI